MDRKDWLTTGEAAAHLGYKSREGFIRKFKGIITSCQRGPHGYHLWLRAEVVAQAEALVERPVAII